MVEPKRSILFSELKKLRQEFGKGRAGSNAFKIIAKGSLCSSYVVLEEKCLKDAVCTIDFDVPIINGLEHFPTCLDHDIPMREKIEHDLNTKFGVKPSLGKNGNGRT